MQIGLYQKDEATWAEKTSDLLEETWIVTNLNICLAKEEKHDICAIKERFNRKI
jgi:hypothetical protein